MATGNSSQSDTHNRPKRRPPKRFLLDSTKSGKNILSSTCTLIFHTMEMTKNDTRLHVPMDEMLHSIFFLGYIHKPTLTPEKFFENHETLETAKEMFPGPFEKYNSQLPTRTPFSILLEMMVTIHRNEKTILEELPKLMEKLKFPSPLHKEGNTYELFYSLESTVICVCYSESDQKRYYGASLSCRKGNSKEILIDLSCLRTWHEFVSHAVMSFYSDGPGDGITFPDSVKSQAYIRDNQVYKERRPCLNCKQLFNLLDADPYKVYHPYGNCAETECLSKLLFNNQDIRGNTHIENHTQEHLERLRDETKARLMMLLDKINIQINNDNNLFYSSKQSKSPKRWTSYNYRTYLLLNKQ